MSDAERLALIEKGLLTDHCIHNFDAGWLVTQSSEAIRKRS